MKGKNLKERGITLIALVITIIVLLILSGVTLSIVLHTGIIDNSQKAVDTYQAQAKNETEIMDYLEDKFGLYISYLDNINGKENQKIITDKDYEYYNPVIPVGFKAVNTEDASWKIVEDKELGKIVEGWNDGLVIEDKDGNQFVWVPVDGVKVIYEKWIDSEKNGSNKYEDDRIPLKVTNWEENEKSQINKYHGFYIGRYESGIPENMTNAIYNLEGADFEKLKSVRNVEGRPVSKKNQIPWNAINYDLAQKNAENMYNDSDFIQSGLVTGTMYDTTLDWLKESKALTENEITKDSGTWGNYKNAPVENITQYAKDAAVTWITSNYIIKPISGVNTSDYMWIIKTGNTDYTKRNNIYDLAGNLWEWSNEKSDTSWFTTRTGAAGYSSLDYPALIRAKNFQNEGSADKGFRVALYIKS